MLPSVNERVYVFRPGSFGEGHYYEGTVIAVTPSGLRDVQVGAGVMRFNKHGNELGNTSFYAHRLDQTPYAVRRSQLEMWARLKDAANEINRIVVSRNVNERWGKEQLAAEVERIQELVNVARQAVEAI